MFLLNLLLRLNPKHNLRPKNKIPEPSNPKKNNSPNSKDKNRDNKAEEEIEHVDPETLAMV
jgi:hypothetical protein